MNRTLKNTHRNISSQESSTCEYSDMTRMCNHFMFKNEISHFFIRMLHKITNKQNVHVSCNWRKRRLFIRSRKYFLEETVFSSLSKIWPLFSKSLYYQQNCSTILCIYTQVTTCEHAFFRVTTTSERYRVMLIRK